MRLSLLLVCCVSAHLAVAEYHRKFEYKHSFKGPHLSDKKGRVLFWTVHGGAFASQDQVRLTASIRSQKGSMWNTVAYEQANWESELSLRVSGRGRVGADGLAMWFRESPGTEGEVFGVDDKWKGLGIFFDSFDNDGGGNNPYIMVILNDGTVAYNHSNDGIFQQLGGCLRDFRNRPYPVNLKMTYIKKELTVYFDFGNSQQPVYELCMQAVGVDLPTKGFFGFSAATGGLADDHDVLAFRVTSLLDSAVKPPAPPVSEDEFEKLQTTYSDFSEKVEQQKEEFYKEHPDIYHQPEERFESTQDRNVRLVLDGQSQMVALVQQLKDRLDEITGVATAPPPPQGGAGQAVDVPREMMQFSGQLQTALQEQQKFLNNLQSLQNQPASSQGGPVADYTPQLESLRATIAELQRDVRDLSSARSGSAATSGSCPEVDCASATVLYFIAALEVVIFVVFLIFQRKLTSANQKKFF